MQKRIYLIALVAFSMSFFGCTITHRYGPFMGQVVDADNGKPIEGTAVLIGFYTKSGTVGGWSWRFADAIETLTDDEGKFHLPPKRINLFRTNSLWDKESCISIFKPGYAAYPGNPRAFSSWEMKHSRIIPENEYIIYYLPKLVTLEQRKENLGDIEYPAGITNEKMPNSRRLESQERVKVGLKPFSKKIWSKEE